MFKSGQISPWSIYDGSKKKQKSLGNIYNPYLFEDVDPQKRIQSKSKYNIPHQNSDKNVIEEYQRLINEFSSQPIDKKVIENSNHITSEKTKMKNKKNKKQITLKIAQFSEMQSNPKIQHCFKQVKQLLQQNLLMKLIKKKIHQQFNPFYEVSLDQQLLFNRQQLNKRESKFDGKNLQQSFVPIGAKQKQVPFYLENLNILHKKSKSQYKTTRQYEPRVQVSILQKNSYLIKYPSNLQIRRNSRLIFMEQLKTLKLLDDSLNLLNNPSSKKQKASLSNVSRPSLKNNGVLIQKYNSISLLKSKY